MQLSIYQIDAFTAERFGGNPAAVVPLDSWLPTETMQAIALENNLSETAFVVAEDGAFGLRWFTPSVEVDLCGHATLATAFVLFNEIGVEASELAFATRGGLLTVRRDGKDLIMDFPRWELVALTDWPEEWAEIIGSPPSELYWTSHDEVLFALLGGSVDVHAARPKLDSFDELEVGALILTASGTDTDCVCRYFAPGYGIPEDPGTGSIHCAIAPFWAERLGKSSISSRQLSTRGASFKCEVAGERVLIKGSAVRYLVGTIEI